jgi:hypothetical protein
MSLTNPVETGFSSSDGVINSKLNDIGFNLNSLESSKVEQGGSITTNTSPTSGSFTATTGTALLFEGFIMLSGSTNFIVEVFMSGGWRTMAILGGGGSFQSTGANVRYHMTSGSATIYWSKN